MFGQLVAVAFSYKYKSERNWLSEGVQNRLFASSANYFNKQ